jgi:hypothetical protein
LACCSFLMPGKIILVPGIFAWGFFMYSSNAASFQMMHGRTGDHERRDNQFLHHTVPRCNLCLIASCSPKRR